MNIHSHAHHLIPLTVIRAILEPSGKFPLHHTPMVDVNSTSTTNDFSLFVSSSNRILLKIPPLSLFSQFFVNSVMLQNCRMRNILLLKLPFAATPKTIICSLCVVSKPLPSLHQIHIDSLWSKSKISGILLMHHVHAPCITIALRFSSESLLTDTHEHHLQVVLIQAFTQNFSWILQSPVLFWRARNVIKSELIPCFVSNFRLWLIYCYNLILNIKLQLRPLNFP
jgi:hypothetical protein